MLDDQAQLTGEGNQLSRPQRTAAPASSAVAPTQSTAPSNLVRRLGLVAAAALAVSIGGYYGVSWWTTGRYMVSTDDAYVGVRSATLSPKVSGYLSAILSSTLGS